MLVKNSGCLLVVLVGVYLFDSFVDSAQAKGNPHAVIVVKSGRTSKFHPLRSVDNLTLWCQAEERGSALRIKSAKFIRKKDGTALTATLSDDGKRASYYLGEATVNEAGNYTCKLTTTSGQVSGNHQVFVRPVLVASESDRLDSVENDAFRFDGLGVTAVLGRNINLTCPVIAFPSARFAWSKDGKSLVDDGEHIRFGSDGILQLFKVTDEDRGVYECTAKNEFPVNGHNQINQVILLRRLRLKSNVFTAVVR
ncbi:unnamed protein product [Anisakis simplex]|uniref:Ig-like domain-containing protein n=1 Tax=Anisakis simplex TaxID=6269 RepID=A0A0M3JR90_ANISI|nr:unnamed protein product [Anisakis simplex]